MHNPKNIDIFFTCILSVGRWNNRLQYYMQEYSGLLYYCDELNQYGNGDAVKRAKARSIGSSILGSKAKERRRRRREENRSKSARFKGLANHVSRQGSVSGSVSGP